MSKKENDHPAIPFLKALYQDCNEATVNLRFLPSAHNEFLPLSKIDSLPSIITAHTGQNVHFAIATREDGNGTKGGISEIPALWVDVDAIPGIVAYDLFVKKYKEFPIKPSVLINSGGGFHLYWFLKEPATKEQIALVEALLKRLASYFGGDMGSTDASRILRIPGTFNYKYSPKRRVSIRHFHPEKRYNPDDFEILPSLKDSRDEDEKSSPSPGWQNEILEGVELGERNTSLARLAGRYLGKGLSEREVLPILMDANSRFRPPLDESEVESILDSMSKTDHRNRRDDSNQEQDRQERGQGQKKAVPLICSRDLLLISDSAETSWAVDKLIPEKSISIISAEAGSYKTWLALKLGRCIGDGIPFLGRNTKRMKVIYIDRENPIGILAKRLQLIGTSENFSFYPLWSEPEPPIIYDSVYLDLASDDVLMIFDSLKRFHRGDENSSSDMSRVSEAFRKLTVRGATVVILHHRGKSEFQDYRGSSEIIAGVDVAFSVRKDESILTLKCIKHRYIQEPHLTLEVQSKEGFFDIADISDNEERVREYERKEKMLTIKELIMVLAKDGGPPIQGRIIQECGTVGIPKGEALELLKSGEGTHWKVDKGARGARVYTIISSFPEFHTIGSGKLENWRKSSESFESSFPEGSEGNEGSQKAEIYRKSENWNPEKEREVVI